jgi:hypothetical protein
LPLCKLCWHAFLLAHLAETPHRSTRGRKKASFGYKFIYLSIKGCILGMFSSPRNSRKPPCQTGASHTAV